MLENTNNPTSNKKRVLLFIIIGVIGILLFCCSCLFFTSLFADTETSTKPKIETEVLEVTETELEEKVTEVPEATKEEEPEEKPEEKVIPPTLGEKNALKKAKNYLNYSAFSREGLIKQLEFEGFSNEEAVYGTDNVGADWNEQAGKKAKSYLDYSAFSRGDLIEQLEFEGFTREQAEHGVTVVGY